MLRHVFRALIPAAVVATFVAGAGPAAAFAGSASVDLPPSGAVGTPVTATMDTTGLSPSPTDYTIVWKSQPTGGGAITVRDTQSGTLDASGTTTATYTPVAGDVDTYVFVDVTYSGGGTYVTSDTMTIHAGTLDAPTALTVTGTARFGQSLTVTTTAASWSPAADAVDITWYDASDSAVLGTGATFTPSSTDIGRTVYAQAHATKAGYTASDVASVFYGAIGPAQMSVVDGPVMPASATVGTPLTVSTPTLTPTPDHLAYQWYRTPDVEIDGATSATYTPTVEDLGTQLYAVVVATRASTQSYVMATTSTGEVALASFGTPPTPTISGSGIIGTPFTCDPVASGWSPTPTTFAYQWFRASSTDPLGTPVAGATAATYTATTDDVGSYLYVRVTASRAGVHDYVVGTAPSATVNRPWVATPGDEPTVTTSTGTTFRLTVHGLIPATTYALELHSTPISLGTFTTAADGTATLTLTLPTGTPAGSHTLLILLDGTAALQVPVVVTAGAGATLAATGASPGPLAALAGLAILLGWGLQRVRRVAR